MRRLNPLISTIVSFSCAVIYAQTAHATAPSCFAERTVIETAELRDETGTTHIGYLRNGAIVTVVDDADQQYALVELAEHAIRGQVEKDKLVVFAREDIELVPGFASLLAGHPLKIEGVTEHGIEVRAAGDVGRQFPMATVSCEKVRPDFEADGSRSIVGLDCDGGVMEDTRLPHGVRAWTRRPVVIEDSTGAHQVRTKGPRIVGILEETEKRARVEIVDVALGVLLQGWVSLADVAKEPPKRRAGFGSATLCTDQGWTDMPRLRRTTVRAGARLLSSPSGAAVGVLSARMKAVVVEQKPKVLRVLIASPTLDPRRAQTILLVWVLRRDEVTPSKR